MIFKKEIVVVWVTVIIFLLASCGKTSESIIKENSPSENPMEEPAEKIDMETSLECIIGIQDNKKLQNEYVLQLFFKNQFNMDVTFRYYSIKETSEMLFKGEGTIDMLMNVTHDIGEHIRGGYIQNLNEYKDIMSDYWKRWDARDELTKWVNMNAFSIMDDSSGNWYGASAIYGALYPQAAWFYREDIFKEMQIEFPVEIEKLPGVLSSINKYTGTAPLLNYDGWARSGIFNAYGTQTSGFYSLVESDELRLACTDDAWPKAFEAYISLAKDGLIFNAQAAANIVVDDNNMAVAYAPLSYINYLKKINDNWKLAPNYLISKEGGKSVISSFPDIPMNIICLNKNSSELLKQRMAYVINWLTTDEGIIKAWFGDENETYVLNSGLIELKASSLAWLSPGHVAVGGQDKSKYDIYTCEGRIRMAAPEWGKTVYAGYNEIRSYIDAESISSNMSEVVSVSFNPDFIYYDEYQKILRLEQEFLVAFTTNPDDFSFDEIIQYVDKMLETGYKDILESYDER